MMLAALGVLVAGTAQAASNGRALRDVPPGWIHVEAESVDTWAFAYHDKVSGAWVRFDVGRPVRESEKVPPLAKKDGTVGGVRYHSERLPDPICGDISENDHGRLHVSFFPERQGRVWNVSALLCTDEQVRRTRDLLFGRMRLQLDAQLREDNRFVTEEELKAVRVGMTWQDVMRALGEPADGEPAEGGGFAAYFTLDKPRWHQVRLAFDQNQRLLGVAPAAR